MFEKEAEIYADNRARKLGINKCNLVYSVMKIAHQKGAEFGYNKAKEELEKAKDIIYQLLMIGKFQFDFCDDETNYYNDCIVKNAEDFIKPKENE